MMELPSESHSWMSQILVPILTTIGAGGALKLYAQFQAGRTSVRAEMQTRIHKLESDQLEMFKTIGDLREQNGRQQGVIDALQRQNASQQYTIDALQKQQVTIGELQKQNTSLQQTVDALQTRLTTLQGGK